MSEGKKLPIVTGIGPDGDGYAIKYFRRGIEISLNSRSKILLLKAEGQRPEQQIPFEKIIRLRLDRKIQNQRDDGVSGVVSGHILYVEAESDMGASQEIEIGFCIAAVSPSLYPAVRAFNTWLDKVKKGRALETQQKLQTRQEPQQPKRKWRRANRFPRPRPGNP